MQGTSAEQPQRGKPPQFLDELELLFGRTTQDRGVLLSAGGTREATPTAAWEEPAGSTPNQSQQHSSDRLRGKRPVREESVNSPQKKKTSSVEDCLREISAAVTRRSRRSVDDEEAQEQVRQILDDDGIPEGDQVYLQAMLLCMNALRRRQFTGMRTKEARLQWIEFNWANIDKKP